MKGFVNDIEKLTKENTNFREVLFTDKNSQLVIMSLKPGEDIGLEVHDDVDQFFKIEEGRCELLIDGEAQVIEDDFAVVVPAGSQHNITNTGDSDLKLYTIYSPPNHPDGTTHKTREEAMEYEKGHH